MINEFQLLKINPENASTKQKIIRILSMEWPLTAKMIYGKMQKEFGTAISYQAVHKILKELEEEKITVRKNDGYELNIEWIQKSIKSLQTIEKQYLKNSKIKLPENFQGSIEINFDSITEICVSTADLLTSRQLTKNQDDNEFVCTLQFGWIPFQFRFEHLDILRKMMEKNPKSKNIIREKTPFGIWIREQYNKIGAVSAPIGTKLEIQDDIFVQGDFIIQIIFDEKSKNMIREKYNKWKNIEDQFKDLVLKEEPKIKAVMKITKNQEMARIMKKYLEDTFEKLPKSF